MAEFFDWLSDPLALAVCLLFLSSLWALWVRKKLLGGLLFLLTGVLYFLGITPGSDLLLRPLEDAYPALLVPPSAEVAAVVVLTGGEAASPGRPVTSDLSESSLERLVEGVRVWRMLGEGVPLIFVGGAGIPGRPAESPLMAQAAEALGVPREAIRWESNSRNTYETPWLQRNSWVRGPSCSSPPPSTCPGPWRYSRRSGHPRSRLRVASGRSGDTPLMTSSPGRSTSGTPPTPSGSTWPSCGTVCGTPRGVPPPISSSLLKPRGRD